MYCKKTALAAVLALLFTTYGASAVLAAEEDAATGLAGEAAPRYATGQLQGGYWNGGLRDVYARIDGGYVHGCMDEEGKLLVAPKQKGPYIGITNGFALLYEGGRDENGDPIPDEAKCAVLNAAGERIRSFAGYITWYDGYHGIAAAAASKDAIYPLRYALTDEVGNPVTAFEFDNIIHIQESSRDVFWAQKDELWGCVKADGTVLLPFEYHRLNRYAETTHVGLEMRGDLQGLATYDGAIVIPVEYRMVTGFSDGLAAVMNDEGKWAYFNTAGENVTGFVYDSQVMPFREGLALYPDPDDAGKYGAMDTNFRTVLQPEYTGYRWGSGTRPGKLYMLRDGVEEVIENPLQYTRDIKIYVNGDWIYTGTEPPIESGRILMPLRGIGEALGYNVQWHPDSREITLANETRVIRMTVGNSSATVNVFGDGIPAETAALDVPPRIVNGRTYIPLRFVAENCGAQVDWDETEKTARIESAPFGVELTADTVNGGRTGVFLRRQTSFYDIESIEGDVTLPTVSLGEKGDCPYVYFGFDQIDDKGNAEGGFQYIEDESRPDFGKWTVFLRQGDAWHWGENIVLEPGSTHHLKFFIENEADLVVELDGHEVIRKPSAAVGFVQPSVKYVIAMAMSKPFDGTNCLSRLDNAKVTNLKADGEDFDRLSRQPEWRPGVGSVGMQFGSADCVPAYVHTAEDGSVSLYKQ